MEFANALGITGHETLGPINVFGWGKQIGNRNTIEFHAFRLLHASHFEQSRDNVDCVCQLMDVMLFGEATGRPMHKEQFPVLHLERCRNLPVRGLKSHGGRKQVRRSQGAYSNRYQVLLHLLCLHKVKPLDERKRSSLFSDMHTPLNPLPGTAIVKGFRAIGACCVWHINNVMRL